MGKTVFLGGETVVPCMLSVENTIPDWQMSKEHKSEPSTSDIASLQSGTPQFDQI